ncbi:26400_t:CDS:2, partial [Gigaspora margarita]
ELLKCLETIVEDITISNYIVANEPHNDGYYHKHIFDININNTIYYPNITGIRLTNSVIDYVTNYGDFISKYKLEKLKVVELYILNRTKIVRLESKIEEQYYESYRKPFVEIHYSDKGYEKSTYFNKYNNKDKYYLDDRWFNGYNNKLVLVINKLTGFQLIYLIFLKLLLGN